MDFQSKYNRSNFLRFLRNNFLWDKFEESIEEATILNNFKSSFFTKITKLWVVEDFDNLIVLEIEHKSKNDARISLTKDIFKLLRQYELEWIIRQHALVILKNPDSDQYRFSLLTTTYNEDFEEKLSNPKRYSFLLWVWEKVKTAKDYLEKKWKVEKFEDLVKRFDVEVVRKDFFNNYLTLYIKLYKAILEAEDFVELLNKQKVDLVSFAKNLLWKIVFLYFIQKKGWLWVGRDKQYWIDWDKNFMRSIWEDFKNNNESLTSEKEWFFYNDYLEWLFYDGLNKDRRDSEDYFPNLKMKVPYLNGWLFKEDYKGWDINISKISNDLFSNALDTGILDIFDTYNFTIDEDDLYDSDIAIDPEMLGRIFEKMISISPDNINEIVNIYESKKKVEIDKELNKKFGAFYTPREIVHYMTKESIISYLVNNLKGKKEEKEIQIRLLFDLKEKFLILKSEITEEIFNELAWIIEEVDLLLQKVKILDPAIGSWAFPMWILHEISTIRYYIYWAFFIKFKLNDKISEFLVDNPTYKLTWKWPEKIVSMYKIKRNIIQNSIYWVDIELGAIDIARLRFWLSLVVDEEIPEPLPNFEFKFVCANTLIPLAEVNEQSQIEFDWTKELSVETLRKYMASYYNSQTNKDKEEWKTKIEKFLWIWKNTVLDLYQTKSERTKQLETYKPFDSTHSAEFFDPSLMMWNSKFDIVIWNPPYIANHDIESNIKKKYDELYFTAHSHYDILILFYELWIKLLKQDWVITYITSNKWLAQKYWIKLRKFIKSLSILQILDFWNNKIFENATVSSEITIIKNTKTISDYKFLVWNYNDKKINFNKLDLSFYNTTFINESNEFNIIPSLNENHFTIKNKINVNSINLDKLMYITLWAVIHSESWNNTKKEFLKSSFEYNLKPYLEWKDILKWHNKNPSLFLKYEPNLHREPRFKELFENTKIVCIRTSNYKNPHRFSIDKDSYIADSCIIAIKYDLVKNQINYNNEIIDWLDDKYILALLNSKLLMWNFFSFYSDWLHFYPRHLKDTPIKQISPEAQKPFIEKVEQILEITKQPWYNPKEVPEEQKRLEKEIDKMVYELYGLSDEEVKVVEESLV